MILSALALESFRNFAQEQLTFSPGANLIFGKNGQGKTNLLEAIFVLAMTKSFRGQPSQDLINLQADRFRLVGQVQVDGRGKKLTVEQGTDGKRVLVNDSKTDILAYIENFSAIIFSSGQLEQFRAEADFRRRIIDRAIYPLQPSHLRRVSDYLRVIRQKNSLLRDPSSRYNKDNRELVDIWNLQIADLGARIIKSRKTYLDRVSEKLAVQPYQFVPESLTFQYVASQDIQSDAELLDVKDQLFLKLNERVQDEFRLRRCLVGPHRDDLFFKIDGKQMHRFASAGQQRSALLAYQLAQMEVHCNAHGHYPVFLVDDVDSELDTDRLAEVLKVIESKTQVFVTTTKPDLVRWPQTAQAKAFLVESGKIQEAVYRG